MSFYVYTHSKADTGEIFYVGKGCNRRAWSTKNRSRYWHNTAAKHGFNAVIAVDGLDEELALLAEVELIDKLRVIGSDLVNLTDGGDGVSGFRPTPEQRKRNSDRQREIARTEFGIARIERMNAIRMSSPDIMEGAIRRRTATMRAPEYRARRSEIARSVLHITIPRLQEGKSRYLADPANRAEIARKVREHASSQSVRDAMSLARGSGPFVCNETGRVFGCQATAAREMGVDPTGLRKVLHGKQKTTKGYTFSYLSEAAK